MKEYKKWSLEEIEGHIKLNVNDSYSAAIVAGALFKKLYGNYPKLGLSGHQASAIDSLVGLFPDPCEIKE